MISLEHAPRLVLGLSSNASLNDVTVSFARASRRLRVNPNAPFEVKDLTAALSQLEGHAADNLYFEYKVPANSEIHALDISQRSDDHYAHSLLLTAIDQLLEWKWEEAKQSAKTVLRETRSEDLRDEALNVIAAASALLGEIDAAINALKQAVEGEWNFALQQNLGILALKADPELAAHQSTFWLDAADTVEDRERAVFLVLNMWASLQGEEESELPEKMRDSFRSVLTEEISVSTFVSLGLFLASNDDAWVSEPSNWIRSPHFGTEVASLILARAEGFEEFVDFLIAHSSNADAEIRQARDNFVSHLLDALLSEESVMWAAVLAMKMVDEGLPCDSLNNALLRTMAIQDACLYFRDNEGEPKDEFITWLTDVQRYIRSLDASELVEFLDGALASTSTILILTHLKKREDEIDLFADALSTVHLMAQRWSSRRRLNKSEARRLATDVRDWANSSQAVIEEFGDLPVTEKEVRQIIQDFSVRRAQIKRMANEILEKL